MIKAMIAIGFGCLLLFPVLIFLDWISDKLGI